jgi:hypothetical protein
MEDNERGDQPYNGHYWKKNYVRKRIVQHTHSLCTDIHICTYVQYCAWKDQS